MVNAPMLLDGLHIPLTTPFHPDGRLFTRKLESNIARYSKTPAAGLILLAPAAEPTLLSDDETCEVLDTAAAAAAPEKLLIAGVSRDSVAATLALADFAATQEYDVTLIGTPSVLLSEPETLTFFQTVADRSALPIILFSGRGSRQLSVAAITELAAHPRILGLIEAANRPPGIAAILTATAAIRREVTVTPTFAAVTARMAKAAAATWLPPSFISADTLAETYSGMLAAVDAGINTTLLAEPPDPVPAQSAAPLRTRARTVGFQIVAAFTPSLTQSLRAGAAGIAPPLSAAAPQACYEVFAAWKDSDQPLADEKQTRLIEATNLAEATPGALKHACDLNGYFGGIPRLPHLPPTGDQRAALERVMHDLRN